MARRKKVKVYQLEKDGATYWVSRYEIGVKNGAKTYEAMIPTMRNNYATWVNFALPEIVKIAKDLPPKIEGADPAVNYERRGAVFARKFRELGRAFSKFKLSKALESLGVVPTPEIIPPPPARVREVPPLA
jgi:hypothetical protein